jgi:hypothetical protein
VAYSTTEPQRLLQNLAPIYEQLADAYSHASDKVIIAKVDADGVGRPLGQKYDVSGFPSWSVSLLSLTRTLNGTRQL